ncbi:MAG: TetR/AcrR family transcriptional regulator [Kofleriaceae bacterium]
MTSDDESLRADARANRERILDAGRLALEADPHASLNSIAKAAGIGPGTLYRHFPDRESLVIAVYKSEIDALAAAAPALLAKHPPLQAFRLWCDRLAKFGRMKHGIANVLDAARPGREAYLPILEAVSALMTACERANAIEPGTDPEDFLSLIGLIWRIPPNAASEARVKRMMAILLRGLGAKL